MEDETTRTLRLHSTTDAQVWAEEWCKVAREIADAAEPGRQVIDEGWMIGWFANAIEIGRAAGVTEANAETETGDIIRQIDKTLDVLSKVEEMMNAEATMNAIKHLSNVVRPVPLVGMVSSLIGDLEAWRQRIE